MYDGKCRAETPYRTIGQFILTNEIQLCSPSDSGVAAHEFGHVMGLDDAYVEGTWEALTTPDDLMARSSRNMASWFHIRVLVEMYQKRRR